jgi:menaquinone-dependent protoporphyrinogen oxidase
MNTAIIYATSHGTTEKVAHTIAKSLGTDTCSVFNLKTSKNINLSKYNQVIIGGSIHAGTIQNSVKSFCKKSLIDLLEKRVGLFLCAMNVKDYQTEFDNAFPEILRNHAVSKQVVGGEFLIEKMNFIERFLVRKISGVSQTVSKIDNEAVNQLITNIQ